MRPLSSTVETLTRAQRALTGDLCKLEEVVQPQAKTALSELQTYLGATYTNVCEHFRLEEQDGFLDDLQKREPRFTRVAEELIEELRELRQNLDTLHGEAIVATRVDDGLRENVRKWIAKMRRHEVRENDLVQDAVDSDVGAQD